MRPSLDRASYRCRDLCLPFTIAPLTSLAMNVSWALLHGLTRDSLPEDLAGALFWSFITTVISYPVAFLGGTILLILGEGDGPSRSLGGAVGGVSGLFAGGGPGLLFGEVAGLGFGGLGLLYGGVSGLVFVSLLPRRSTFRERLARIAARELALQEASR